MENQPAPPTFFKQSISNFFIIIPVVIFLVIIGATGYFAYQNYQLKKQAEPQFVPMLIAPNRPPKSSLKSIILKTPVIEYETPGNKLTKVIITGYQDKIITVGEEFIINPATLGWLYESSLGDIKLKLIEVKKSSIIVNVLADEIYDGSFFPRNPIEREEIIETKCLIGRPLAMDVYYKYCFTLSTGELQPSLSYTITEKSTMPPIPPS